MGPDRQHLAAKRGQPHPLGETLAVDLTAQHPQLNQPDEQLFAVAAAQAPVAQVLPVAARLQLAAAKGAALELLVEGQFERQALHGPAGARQGTPIRAGRGGVDHTERSGAAILMAVICQCERFECMNRKMDACVGRASKRFINRLHRSKMLMGKAVV